MLLLVQLNLQLIALTIVYLLLTFLITKGKGYKFSSFNSRSDVESDIFSALLFAIPIAAVLYFAELLVFKEVSFTQNLINSAPLALILVYVACEELFWRGVIARKLNPLLQIGIFSVFFSVLFSNGSTSVFINNFINLVAISAACTLALRLSGTIAAILTRVFLVLLVISASTQNAVPLYLILLFAPIAILYNKNKDVKKTLGVLKLTSPVQSKKQIITQTAVLVFATLLVLLIESLVLSTIGANDGEKVAATINTFPVILLITAITLGPIAEEVFFRGFLSQKIGVVLSALAFGALHFGYGSVTEIVGAFSIGLLFGWWVKYKNSSLWPVIIAHAAYNAIAIIIALKVA